MTDQQSLSSSQQLIPYAPPPPHPLLPPGLRPRLGQQPPPPNTRLKPARWPYPSFPASTSAPWFMQKPRHLVQGSARALHLPEGL